MSHPRAPVVGLLGVSAAFAFAVGVRTGREVAAPATRQDAPALTSRRPAPPGSVPRFASAALPPGAQRTNGCAGNAAGAAWADIDGDGVLDLYLPEPAGPGRLWIGASGGRFAARSLKTAGIPALPANAASFADFDGDGRPDLYLAARGHDRLLRNVGGRFRDVTRMAGTVDPGPGTSVAWVDIDRDGRLDLYVSDGDNCRTPRATPDRLYRNLGRGRFADVSRILARSGATTDGIGMQAVWADVDRDGDPDLYLANDHLGFRPNELWRNDGPRPAGQSFTPIGRRSGAAVAISSMGAASGDLDGDGRLDLVVSDMNRAPLVLLRRGAGFVRRRLPAPPGGRPTITWGVAAQDFNNDGAIDVLAAGGALGLDAEPQPDVLYLGDGHGDFTAPGPQTGVGDPGRGRAVATADVDHDGLLDALVTRLGQAPLLLMNRGPRLPPGRRHWLELRLTGSGRARDPCGAVVRARHGRWHAVRVLSCGSDGAASSEHLIHVGLGAVDRVALTISWPSGRRQRLAVHAVDRLLSVREPRR